MFSRTLRQRSSRVPFLAPTKTSLRPAFYTITASRSAKKGAEGKDEISTESTEYSKSGGDGASSNAVDDAAFSRDKTRPEDVYQSAKKESGGDVSLSRL
jgi:hypothetical protein